MATEVVSESLAPGQAQGVDAIGEQVIKDVKHEPRLSDSHVHWDHTVRLTAQAGSMRSGNDHWLAMLVRNRRQRIRLPTQQTVTSMRAVLRSGKAFVDLERTEWTDLQLDELAPDADDLFAVGEQRLRQFVTERFVDKKVDVLAPRKEADTVKHALSLKELDGASKRPTQAQLDKRKQERQARAKAMDTDTDADSETESESADSGVEEKKSSAKRRGARSERNGKSEREDDDSDYNPKQRPARQQAPTRQSQRVKDTADARSLARAKQLATEVSSSD
jgi:hypothetical protein